MPASPRRTVARDRVLVVDDDPGIRSLAKDALTAAGYADLLAKVTAGADWILADALGAEPLDAHAWALVQAKLLDALADPQPLLHPVRRRRGYRGLARRADLGRAEAASWTGSGGPYRGRTRDRKEHRADDRIKGEPCPLF